MEASLPSPTTLEVSVFGTGFGESIAIHVGASDWIIVDSCINPDTGRAVCLDYLESLGVDPASAVKLLIATHWHKDHIEGLHDIFTRCPQAKLSISPALRDPEALTFVMAHSRNRIDEDVPVSEMHDLVRTNAQRKNSITWAGPNRILWERAEQQNPAIPAALMASLSPSDLEISKSITRLSQSVPKPKQRLLIPLAQDPNDLAIVNWVRFGNVHLLLGSDLETTGDTRSGWDAVVSQFSSAICARLADFFKVAHHGSVTGHHEGQWSRLLATRPISVLTTFSHADHRLPNESDVARIRSLSSSLHIAGGRGGSKPLRKDKLVQQFIKDSTRWIAPRDPKLGYVRTRWELASNQPPTIEIFGTVTRVA